MAFQGNHYTHERRLFELEARRLGVEKAAKTRRMKREATDSLKAPGCGGWRWHHDDMMEIWGFQWISHVLIGFNRI